ncbi:uncharacterized protein LOC131153420 [Malania oleifera]|uniref:uncharacterized protein LOC131153420 n=1 Tax=Malania oleifera TaxID=397392 RepID=UPI0025ADB588|nr:uncharacterized protein LOC131153420 [Malania oleifera]
MATLQKFKLFATQCAVPSSPSRSPAAATTSPVVQLRRRKSLRMLLSCSSAGLRHISPDRRPAIVAHPPPLTPTRPERDGHMLRHTLKDLFVSSPPFEDDYANPKVKFGGGAEVFDSAGPRLRPGSPRPGFVGLRHRLIRKTWRPVLVTIPEYDDI